MDKISFEEHEIIGMITKILNHKLLGTIPKCRTKAELRKCHHIKANEGLNNFRNHMEEIMFVDNPKKLNTGVYYGDRPEDCDIIKWLRGFLDKRKTPTEKTEKSPAKIERKSAI